MIDILYVVGALSAINIGILGYGLKKMRCIKAC